jgi:hypothetical protein
MKYLLSPTSRLAARLRRALDFYLRNTANVVLMGDIINYGPRNGVPEGSLPKACGALNPLGRRYCGSVAGQLRVSEVDLDAALVSHPRRLTCMSTPACDTAHHGTVIIRTIATGRYDAFITGHPSVELSVSPTARSAASRSITFPMNGNPPTLAIMEHGIFTMLHPRGEPLASLPYTPQDSEINT